MGRSLLGTRVERREDPTLLTGEGDYVADLAFEGLLHAKFVTSAEPHARIKLDVAEAESVEGVVAVYTAEALGDTTVPQRFVPDPSFARLPLAKDVVKFVGESVAMVIAETPTAAHDGSELVVVDYTPLPVSMDAEAVFTAEHGGVGNGGVDSGMAENSSSSSENSSMQPSSLSPPSIQPPTHSPRLYPERGSDTLSMRFDAPDFIELEDLSPEQVANQQVVTLRLENNRMAVVPLEPHAIVAQPHSGGKFTIWLSSQGPHSIQAGLAKALELDPQDVRVISPWVGGGFGGKGGWVPEHVAVARAAQLLGRPVGWLQDRTENLLSMHARHQVQYGRLRMDESGLFASLETHALADAGGYVEIGGLIPTGTRLMAQGVYKFPQVRSHVGAACTNKAPTTAFRGAGRPQATCLIERLVDLAAAELEVDPLELRLKNLLPPEDFPVSTATGATYDTGDYAVVLHKAAELAGYDTLRAEQEQRREAGNTKLLGIGLCCYVEVTGGAAGPGGEFASVEVTTEGKAIVKAGTSSHGQGLETVFATIVSDRLGISEVEFIQSDTAEVLRGQGTAGSRSGQMGGSAVAGACDQVLADARRIAAHLLEASEADIVVAEGGLSVAGVPTAFVGWAELAAFAKAGEAGASDLPTQLFCEHDFKQANATYPFGAHVSVVEVDTETGAVEVLRHVAVDDCGVVMNPMIVQGQQHGGIASGVAQALWEHVVYDEDGNPRTTNLAEYLMPSAAEFPFFEVYSNETPTDLNPLGVKGIGEAGTIGAIPATHNAVIDALSHLGVRHLDMPLTPEKLWTAIQEAQAHGRVPASQHPWPSYATG